MEHSIHSLAHDCIAMNATTLSVMIPHRRPELLKLAKECILGRDEQMEL